MAMDRRAAVPVGIMLAAVLLVSPAAHAQDADRGLEGLWQDFVHYVKIARPELAQSFGQAILEGGAPAKDLYRLATETQGLETVLTRAEGMDELTDVVAELREVINLGYVELRADPQEIATAIDMLTSGGRSYSIGARRLVESGEFALPQLLQKLTDPTTAPALKERIISLLPRMERHAVRGLSAALQTNSPELQEALAGVLGKIAYPHAVPRLRELYERDDILDRTKLIVGRALVACGGEAALTRPLADLYFDMAVAYYDGNDSVLPDMRFRKGFVWQWQEGQGLVFKHVPLEIFLDVYAMRMSRLTLQHDPEFQDAVPLWLAAIIRKEADLPEGATDPLWGDTPSAAFYTRAAGAGYVQQTLARALEDYDARVAAEAIKALADTAGPNSLVAPLADGKQPLVKGLTFPERQVRYLAAVSLAQALPEEVFPGSTMVLAVLNEALRERGQKVALVMVSDTETGNLVKDSLREVDAQIIAETDYPKAVAEAHRIGGVDVVFIASANAPGETIAKLRMEPLFAITPVVLVGTTDEGLARLAERDGRVVLLGYEVTSAAVKDSLIAAGKLAAGKDLQRDDRTVWAVRAAQAVRTIGTSGNTTFDLERSRLALEGALMSEISAVRVAAAKGLAVLASADAQRAILKLPGDMTARDPDRLAGLTALAESVRRFGNQLTDADAAIVLALVSSTDESKGIREAAAQVLGAMDLPSEQIFPLIHGTAGHD